MVRHNRHLRPAHVPVLSQRQRQSVGHVGRQRRHESHHRQSRLRHSQQPQETGQLSIIADDIIFIVAEKKFQFASSYVQSVPQILVYFRAPHLS